MILEIRKHSGPARMGCFEVDDHSVPTPRFFSIVTPRIRVEHELYLAMESTKTDAHPIVVQFENKNKGAGILPDLQVGFNVPREIAELSVEKTIEIAKQFPEMGATVQGSKYLDLRVKCAEALREHPLIVIANGRELIEHPRLAVEIITSIRETVSPNTALYLPGAPPHMFYILSYMGIDLFDNLEGIIRARRNEILTPYGTMALKNLKELPCSCAVCINSEPADLIGDFHSVLQHNHNVCLQVVKEIREAIRENTMRELVEEKAASDVNSMVILRSLDMEKQGFLEKYTPIS
jgi:queuine/archaeosine tRNA-ribosyltransferase